MTVQFRMETKTEQITRKHVDSVTCDLCGVVQKGAYAESTGEVEWGTGETSYHKETTEVVHASGTSYPEGGDMEYTILHICPECFHEKILPLAQGKHTHERSDW